MAISKVERRTAALKAKKAEEKRLARATDEPGSEPIATVTQQPQPKSNPKRKKKTFEEFSKVPKGANYKDMDISKLYVGLEVKNYKELCKLLSVPEVRSSSKQSQLKELNRYIAYERKGQKYIITQIYERPLEKVDKRKGDLSRSLDKVLLYGLVNPDFNSYFKAGLDMNATNKQDEVFSTFLFAKKVLVKALGLANSSYGVYKIPDQDDGDEATAKSGYSIISERSIPYISYQLFLNDVSDRLTKIIVRALSSLQKKGILTYDNEILIGREHKAPDGYSFGHVFETATEDEKKAIAEVDKYVRNTYYDGCSLQKIALKRQMIGYYNWVDQTVHERYGWSSVIRRTRINLLSSSRDVQYYISHKDDEDLREEALRERDNLNRLFVEEMRHSVKLNYNRNVESIKQYNLMSALYQSELDNIEKYVQERLENGEYKYHKNALNAETKRIEQLKPKNKKPFERPDTYVGDAYVLIDEFLKINS